MSKTEPDSGYTGAVVHGTLAVIGLAEFFISETKVRKFLSGLVVGWHVHSTVWHLRERAENRRQYDRT